jgi:hypothetical protein
VRLSQINTYLRSNEQLLSLPEIKLNELAEELRIYRNTISEQNY